MTSVAAAPRNCALADGEWPAACSPCVHLGQRHWRHQSLIKALGSVQYDVCLSLQLLKLVA